MIFIWKNGSSEGLARGDEGCIAHVKKPGNNGFMADLWEYQGKVMIDLTACIGTPSEGEIKQDRVEITNADLGKSHYETPEDWADIQLAHFLEAKTVWRRP